MYNNSSDANAVGGVFILFVVIAILFCFIVGPSEDEYKRKVASGEITVDTETEYDPAADMERMIKEFKSGIN